MGCSERKTGMDTLRGCLVPRVYLHVTTSSINIGDGVDQVPRRLHVVLEMFDAIREG